MRNIEIIRNELVVASGTALQQGATRLDGVLGGQNHQTVGEVFNMTDSSTHEREVNPLRLNQRETGRGTSLISLNLAGRMALKDLAPGSIINLTAVGSRDFTKLNDKDLQTFTRMFDAITTVATVIAQTDQETELFGYVRQPRDEDKAKNRNQGMWGNYTIDNQGTVRDEKQDAMELLARLFHGEKGNEATNVMSTVFSATTGDPAQMDRTVTAEGCNSHENPRATIGRNFLTGYFAPRSISITSDNIFIGGNPSTDKWALEANLDLQGGIQPLRHTNDFSNADESPLYVAGLESTAKQIAMKNPQGFGRGTQSGAVVEALLETATALPEYADGKVADAVYVFRRNLGLRT